MSEDSDIIQTEQSATSSMSHQRILWTMAVVAILGGLASFIFVSWQFGVGVLFGGVLSFVNYYWLKISLKNAFGNVVVSESEEEELAEKPRFLTARYIFRYFFLGLVLYIIWMTKLVPIASVLLGLVSFAMAILIEAVILIFNSVFFNSQFTLLISHFSLLKDLRGDSKKLNESDGGTDDDSDDDSPRRASQKQIGKPADNQHKND